MQASLHFGSPVMLTCYNAQTLQSIWSVTWVPIKFWFGSWSNVSKALFGGHSSNSKQISSSVQKSSCSPPGDFNVIVWQLLLSSGPARYLRSVHGGGDAVWERFFQLLACWSLLRFSRGAEWTSRWSSTKHVSNSQLLQDCPPAS